MARAPKKTYPQGAVTRGSLEYSVNLTFKLRPSGWSGNDHWAFNHYYLLLERLIPIVRFVLLGDEDVQIKQIKWRRPGETWQIWRAK